MFGSMIFMKTAGKKLGDLFKGKKGKEKLEKGFLFLMGTLKMRCCSFNALFYHYFSNDLSAEGE